MSYFPLAKIPMLFGVRAYLTASFKKVLNVYWLKTISWVKLVHGTSRLVRIIPQKSVYLSLGTAVNIFTYLHHNYHSIMKSKGNFFFCSIDFCTLFTCTNSTSTYKERRTYDRRQRHFLSESVFWSFSLTMITYSL